MADYQDTIRRLYTEHESKKPFRALWKWARAGKSRRERYRRWKALQRWAQGQRENAHGAEREKWNNRRRIYRTQKWKVLRRIHDAQGSDASGLGVGPWAGSQSIIEATVLSAFATHGIAVTSTKRWATYGNPGSDHYAGNTTAYAADGAIANAQWLHDEVEDEFRDAGIPLSGNVTDYASLYCRTPNGRQYRYQGIAATHGTGPHYHGGVRLI